jgi:hypothetical protein
MQSDVLYQQAPDVVMRRLGDESVIVPVRNRVGDLDSVFTLNDVASRVWDLLDGNNSVEAIISTVCREYEVTPEVARTDVSELLRTLEEAQLVSRLESR